MSLFKKKTDAEPEIGAEAGAGKNKLSLLILLVILAVFGYLYFFTSLIVPHKTPPPEKSAEPAAVPQVKQSLPPRPVETAAAPAAAPAPAPSPTPADAKPAPATAPQAKPAAPAPPAAAPAAKPAAPPAKPVKPAEQKPAPAPAKKEVAKAAEKAAPAKGAPTAAQPAKKEQKPAAADTKAKGAKPAETAPVKASAQAYTISVGEFSAADAAAVEAKLGKSKVKPVIKRTLQKNRQMTRLFYGSYVDYDSYAIDLVKLKESAKGAFAIEKDGRYTLYAGSFGSSSHAAAEKKRLAAKGVKVEAQQVSLPVSTVKLSVGPFAGKEAADKAAARLKSAGLVVKVIPTGK